MRAMVERGAQARPRFHTVFCPGSGKRQEAWQRSSASFTPPCWFSGADDLAACVLQIKKEFRDYCAAFDVDKAFRSVIHLLLRPKIREFVQQHPQVTGSSPAHHLNSKRYMSTKLWKVMQLCDQRTLRTSTRP